jgi:hypothetical protein
VISFIFRSLARSIPVSRLKKELDVSMPFLKESI